MSLSFCIFDKISERLFDPGCEIRLSSVVSLLDSECKENANGDLNDSASCDALGL